MRDKRHKWQDKDWGDCVMLATKSVGTTAAQQVTWLLDFIHADGRPLKQATAEVCWFTWCAMTDSWDTDDVLLSKPGGWSLAARPPVTADEIDGFKRFVRDGVAALLRQEDWWTRLPSRGLQRGITAGKVTSVYLSQDPGPLTISRIRAQDLVAQHLKSIAQCRRVKCGRFFLVNKRQEYCSKHCSQIERTTKWRQKLRQDALRRNRRPQNQRAAI